MKVKVFQPNHHGKIEFTRVELEKLLNEVYSDGYKEGEYNARSSNWTWTSPSINTTPYYVNGITTCDDKITISNCDANKSIDKLTCKSNNTNNTNDSIKSTVDNIVATCAQPDTKKNEATSVNNPFTYTIQLDDQDMKEFNKVINELIFGANNSNYNQTIHKNNDPFTNLAKELGL